VHYWLSNLSILIKCSILSRMISNFPMSGILNFIIKYCILWSHYWLIMKLSTCHQLCPLKYYNEILRNAISFWLVFPILMKMVFIIVLNHTWFHALVGQNICHFTFSWKLTFFQTPPRVRSSVWISLKLAKIILRRYRQKPNAAHNWFYSYALLGCFALLNRRKWLH